MRRNGRVIEREQLLCPARANPLLLALGRARVGRAVFPDDDP